MSEREELEKAIAAFEAQRAALGDVAVDAALAGLRQKLAEMERAGDERRRETALSALAGERKLVTVMFADIAGFTALSEERDPEAVRELMNECFDRLVPIVEHYEGTVDKFIGDEIMVLFGAPVAHENDAERALRTALEMMDVLAAFNAEHAIDLGMHIGVNTGLVIAGSIGSEGRRQYSVMGNAVNVAARLEDASRRGEILVGPDTRRLTAPLFDFESLEPVRVKGKTDSVAVYRLVGLKAAPGEVRGVEGLHSPLVGRDGERGQLEAALDGLRGGKGGILVIVGEAGLGKSRLVAEVRKTHQEDLTWVEGRALSYAEGTSFWIARDVLFGLIGVKAEIPPDEVDTALRDSVEWLLPEQVAEVYPYLAHLLHLSLDEDMTQRIQRLTPQALQARMLRAFSAYVRGRSRQQPLVLVWEDLHWADASSLNLLEALFPLSDEAPVLLLLLFRPEGERIEAFHKRVGETRGERCQAIELAPLSRDESTRLVQNLLEIENLPDQARRLILDKVEGNPFFLEEVLRSLLDAGLVVFEQDRAIAAQEIKEIDVPDTLHGVIAARIDRLPARDKETLQTASVIGRVFQQRVLAKMVEKQQGEEVLDTSLDELRRRELIRLREAQAARNAVDQEYIFKHVLTQDVTYNGLLIAQRKALHKVAGEAIEALFPERLEELAATLAYHFDRAEVFDKALAYLRRAGERAVRLSANEEAIAHLTRGLALLETMPDTPERDQEELGLQLALAAPLQAMKGYAAPETGRAYARARELCQQIDDTPQLFSALFLLGGFHVARAKHKTAFELGEEILHLAQRLQDPLRVALAHWGLGCASVYLGEFERARTHAEHTIAFYDPQQHRGLAFVCGQDPGVSCMAWRAWSLWFLGYPDQALKQSRETLALAQELDHPFTLGFAMYIAGVTFHQLRREADAAWEHLEKSNRLSSREGLVFFQAWHDLLWGWAKVAQESVEQGIALMRRGLAAVEITGTRMHRPHLLSLLAEAHGKLGQTEEGLASLAEALAMVEETGERFWEAELHRLKGELLLMQGEDPHEADMVFRQAIYVARRQQAKPLELRATMSLCRLLQQQGEGKEAHKRLAEVYGWFTEGFDTPDLQEAKALLEDLSGE